MINPTWIEASHQWLFLYEHSTAVVAYPSLGPMAIMPLGEHRFDLVQQL